jgi:hypothetical protein
MPTPPVLEHATESNRIWREHRRPRSLPRKHEFGRVGTTFSFTLNEPANVSFAFTQQVNGRAVNGRCVVARKKDRHMPPCKRATIKGALSFAGHSANNKVYFQGRMARSRRLLPGSYTLVITATNAAGLRSSPARLGFTIVRGRRVRSLARVPATSN